MPPIWWPSTGLRPATALRGSDRVAGQIALQCRCGTVRYSVEVPRRGSGTRLKCYCRDCQTAAHALGRADFLDRAGGSDLWQTTPDLLAIEAGQNELQVLRLSPNGLFRWHASCCGSPVCNTLPRLSLGFVGVGLDPERRQDWDRMLGPVYTHANTTGAKRGGGAPAKDVRFGAAGVQMIRRMAMYALVGQSSKSPLRDARGQPIAPVRVLSLEERRAAHAALF